MSPYLTLSQAIREIIPPPPSLIPKITTIRQISSYRLSKTATRQLGTLDDLGDAI